MMAGKSEYRSGGWVLNFSETYHCIPGLCFGGWWERWWSSWQPFCYGLNVCVPLKFLCWNLTSNVMIFRGEAFDGWLGRECEALMHRIRALLQETPESSLILFLPCEDTSRRQTLTRYRICGTLILDFPASRTVRSKSFLFKPPSLQHFVTAVREQRHVQNCETLYKVVLNH